MLNSLIRNIKLTLYEYIIFDNVINLKDKITIILLK